MLTAEGCRRRRERLLERLRPAQSLLLADPVNLRYLANFHSDPFSLGGDYGGLLLLTPDGRSRLFHENKLAGSAKQAHVDQTDVIPWYDGLSPGRGPRHLVLLDAVKTHGGHIHDSLGDPHAQSTFEAIADLRRRKHPDEVELLRACMRATNVGHAWARQHVAAGMTELEVYTGITQACMKAAEQAAIVYGDFAVSPGSARRGGPPTVQVLKDGDMLIIDFSVVLFGYRSDFTNTLVVGGRPSAEQQRLMRCCQEALSAGESELRDGASCLKVYNAVRGSFDRVGMAQQFPHHAGHGLGLGHPEAPFFVRHANETLMAGDVVTLEPGLYVDGVGGVRIERNYLVTEKGFECLSGHQIGLT